MAYHLHFDEYLESLLPQSLGALPLSVSQYYPHTISPGHTSLALVLNCRSMLPAKLVRLQSQSQLVVVPIWPRHVVASLVQRGSRKGLWNDIMCTFN